MDTTDKLLIDVFPGKIVRKDLTTVMKKGANVPTYVLEYLLGMYCSTDDETIIQAGINKIKTVLSQNYVKPNQSDYIKSKIRENGQYTIIDKISVAFNEHVDKYIATFTNLRIDPFEVSSDLVTHNEKLLLGGIWCVVTIKYNNPEDKETYDENEMTDIFGNKKKVKVEKKVKTKFDSPFEILNLKPIQMPNLNLDEIVSKRSSFSKEEWTTLLLRSAGYEPSELTEKQKMHFLLRFVPLVQKNYNLVELGPRGTGKSHVYSELSPYSILLSGGYTTSSNLFFNIGRRNVGLVGHWDCIAFDEVGGMRNATMDTIQIMKNYMANASFARGQNSINADASFAFEGNIFKSVTEMLRTTNLFDPFPEVFNSDSAFFDRIHAYLPGWETPKMKMSLLTDHFGLISDCFSEFCHGMRVYDFTNSFNQYFDLNKSFNTRDDIAVRRTFSGLAKLLYPDGIITKEQAREILEYAIECRRRVKEQLKKMTPIEFNDVDLGYIDLETNEEKIIYVPEQPKSTLIYDGFDPEGYVYCIGKSVRNNIAVYRLENKLIPGNGKFEYKNIEGIGSGHLTVKKSLMAAFQYFTSNVDEINRTKTNLFDYTLYFNDLQNKGVSDEVSVAEVVGLCSALSGKSVKPSTAIVGRVVMSGSMMPLTTALSDIVVAARNAGAKTLLLPVECKDNYNKLPGSVNNNINAVFYETPLEAAKKALDLGVGHGK